MYAIGNKLKRPMGKFQITTTLRNLWRVGHIRRYVRGKTNRSRKVGRGEWYGVHYSLYPINKNNK